MSRQAAAEDQESSKKLRSNLPSAKSLFCSSHHIGLNPNSPSQGHQFIGRREVHQKGFINLNYVYLDKDQPFNVGNWQGRGGERGRGRGKGKGKGKTCWIWNKFWIDVIILVTRPRVVIYCYFCDDFVGCKRLMDVTRNFVRFQTFLVRLLWGYQSISVCLVCQNTNKGHCFLAIN